ncbi:Integrase zinc-binding domain - like 10 [Theobroma cacao]|nr:Integrase zinc-binding domain - like 10 [Theobroma cacao]
MRNFYQRHRWSVEVWNQTLCACGDVLRREILEEAHMAAYVVHPGAIKMYQDLKEVYWWEGLKKDVAEFVSKCLNRYLPLVEFAYNNSFQASIQMAPFEALYGQRCKSPIGWLEVGERKLLGLELVQDATKKIRLTNKGAMRFGKKGKLSPWYIGPFEILERVGAVAYHLALPLDLSNLHPVFHVSMLRKYNPDPSHVIQYETIQLRDDLTYEEQPVAIFDRQVKKFRSKEIALMKMLWRNHTSEEVTWEVEEEMRTKYPYLFNM